MGEQGRMEQALKEGPTVDLQAALYKIAKAALDSKTLLELCQAVHRILASLLPAKNIYIALYDEQTDSLRFPYFVDEYDTVQHRKLYKAQRGMTEYILRRREMVLIHQAEYERLLAAGEIEQLGTPPLQWLGTPLLLSNGRTIGALVVQTYDAGVCYNEQDKEVLRFVSTQIASTLERKLTAQELQESEEKYRAIVEATHDGIFIYQENAIVYGNQQFYAIWGGEATDFNEQNPVERLSLEERKWLIDIARGYYDNEALLVGREMLLEDTQGQQRVLECNISRLHFAGRDALLGVVRDITERKLNERLRDALYRISDTVNLCANLEAVYEAVHHIISDFVHAENFFIALYDEKTDTLSFPYYIDAYDPPPQPERFRYGLTEYVIRTRSALIAPRQMQETLYRQGVTRRLGTPSVDWLGVPLRTTDDRVLGALVVQSYTEGITYSTKDQEILLFVSAQVAMAIERKRAQEQIRYFSWHDALTGLFNRAYFEQQMLFLEQTEQLVTIVIGDVDGLKLINDTLGHATGDQLLQSCAQVLADALPPGAMLARIGGDEFAVLLFGSRETEAQHFCQTVYAAMEQYNLTHECVRLNMSLGYASKDHQSKNLADVFKEADNYMYREKLHRSQSTRSNIFNTLKKMLEARDFVTEGHGDRMQYLAEELALAIGLPKKRLPDIRLFAQFHDIGKVGIADAILFKRGRLTGEEWEQMQRHAEIGYRIAQSTPDLQPIADWILKHHEHWDGQGYPLGLAGKDIPLACRMLAIVDAYDAMTSERPYRRAMTSAAALAEIERCSGSQFDPTLVRRFAALRRAAAGTA